MQRSRSALLAIVAAGTISFAVYVRTLLPGMAFGDWGEMQTVPHVLGVAHPTGYPTYIGLAWLAQLIPIGSVAVRANLLSAAFIGLSVATAVAIMLRLGVRPLLAAAAALAFGAVGTVWGAATVAEVNPLHLLFVTLVLHRALIWQARPSARDLVIGSALIGLAIGNHLLMLFVAPFVMVFVVWVGRRAIAAMPAMVPAAAIAGLLGLPVYLYIPIAASLGPPLAYNHPTTFDAFFALVSGAQFRGQFGFLSPDGIPTLIAALPALWALLVANATPVLPVLAAIGLIVLTRTKPAFGLTLIAILVTTFYLWANYLRLEHYLLVSWLIMTIGVGAGIETIAQAIARSVPGILRSAAIATSSTLALALAIGLAGLNWTMADRSADRSAETYVDTIMATLPENAAILTEWDASTPLWHARYVLGQRPDVLIVDDSNIVYDGWGTREARIDVLICERPVFMLRLDEGAYAPTRVLYRLTPVVTVRIALGGPSAAVERELFRVQPLDPNRCPG